MAKPILKLVLSPSRDIPFDRLVLSQSNVRRVKAGVSIGELAEDIVRRTLLQSLNVRPVLDDQGEETGMFEVPAGGRRYRALELLVKQKRLAKNAPVPCVVRTSAPEGATAEEDSLAENTFREQLHPLDQFKAMQILVDQGLDIAGVAARFMTTPAVVEQRLSLASVSPRLHEVYAEDGMTLGQLMAFTVSKDHARQEQTWDLVANSWNNQPNTIRARLTEQTVRATDRRVRFIGTDAYVAAGGAVMRDLFEDDNGGWLQDVGLLDQLVAEKLGAEGERIGAEGWKWVAVALDFAYGQFDGLRAIESVEAPITPEEQQRIDALKAEGERLEVACDNAADMPADISARIDAIDEGLAFLLERPPLYDPIEMARAGAFVSLDHDGSLHIERGYVRPEDEPAVEAGEPVGQGEEGDQIYDAQQAASAAHGVLPTGAAVILTERDDADEDVARPLPERLVSELTAHRTIALRDALASSPSTAYLAVLHAMVLSVFHFASRESCLGLSIIRPSFPHQAPAMKDSASAGAVTARHEEWKQRLPKSDRDLWDALSQFDSEEQGALFAHCAAYAVNALWEPDNGRISAHAVQRRLGHSHVLARAVGLDMVGAGWKPSVDNYLGRVTKPRILEAVTEAKGEQTAGLIDHLKKGDMAREAERLLDGAGWLPEPLRTPVVERPVQPGVGEGAGDADPGAEDLPAFIGGAEQPAADGPDSAGDYAIAAE